MYESFYGLREKPFRMVPDPGYLYLSPKHQKALTYLEYGLMEEVGFILLTGEIGAGKTTLIRYLLNRMDKDIITAVVFNTNFSASEIVDRVLQSLDLEPAAARTDSLERLYAFLIEKYAERKRVLLIIDEAQNLSRESLEEVRMLSNLQSDDKSLLRIMLVGQPELRDKLGRPELISFAQRIAVQYHIHPLSREEMVEYVRHRLRKAGGREDIFEEAALDLVYEASGGIPRTVNLLCDAALVYGFGYEMATIGTEVIRQVIEDKGGMGLGKGAAGEQGGAGRAEILSDADAAREGSMRLEARIDEIAGRLDSLKERIEELDKTAGRYAMEMALKMKGLFVAERRRSDKLLLQLIKQRKPGT